MAEEIETPEAAPQPSKSSAKKRAGLKTRGKRSKRKAAAPPKPVRVQISGEQLPRKSLDQALRIPRTLREVFAGGPAAWPDLAKATGLSLSQPNKYYLWAAHAYGLVEKTDETFSISETARKILAPTKPNEDREAIVKAVLTPILFSRFFTDYNGSPYPADEHIGNVLEVRYGIPR